MKKLLTLLVTSVLLTGCTLPGTQPSIQENTTTPVPMESPTTAPESTDSATTGTTTSYTLAEVAEHATPEDCWLVINREVYDVTSFIAAGKHPGGDEILKGCGKDATVMFSSTDGGKGHPAGARAFAGQFKIGLLAQ